MGLKLDVEDADISISTTKLYRSLGAGLLVLVTAAGAWLAYEHRASPAYWLLPAGNLLLAVIIYAQGRGKAAAPRGALTLGQIVRDGLGDDSSGFVQMVIDGLPDPVFIVNTEHQVTAMNKAALAAGGDRALRQGQSSCGQLMQRFGVPCEAVDRPCALASGEACKHIQERTTADGASRPVEIRMTPLVDESGEFVGAIEVLHDLTDSEQVALKLRQAKEDAETVSQAKSECVAMMSHEVRTPMNAVLGMADLLQLTALTRKQQDYVRTIQSSGSALLSLVDNVLDYAELQSGGLVLRDQPFNIRLFAEHILQIMGFQAYSKGLELGCRVASDLPLLINGDEDRLSQVMVNLVTNAVRYSKNGEVVIFVRTRTDDDGERFWTCSVTDSGIGITPDIQARLFDPFLHGIQPGSIGTHGSGLGLTVCKSLIEAMGGSIDVHSEAGHGTRVSFELPLCSDEPAVTGQASENLLAGGKALIIHGNRSMTSIIGEYLSDYGMSWETDQDGVAGLRTLQDAATAGEPYGAVIIDASLPGLDGLSVLRRIRAESAIASLPAILLTPIAFPLKVGEISAIGGIRCINKPVLPSDLRRNLNKLLSSGGVSTADAGDNAVAGLLEDTGNLRILVAEDNDLSRQLLQNMLLSLDLEADAVADGPSVLQALAKEEYDVVLMDCQMPGMDGDEVTRVVRSEPDKYRSQPVIVAVTADVSAKHRIQCREAGMDDFLGKPIRRRQLVEGLRHWCADLEYVAESTTAKTAREMENEVLQQLQDRGAAGTDFLRDYVDLFIDDTKSRLNLLNLAAAERDWETVRREAHALTGACLEMGASAMSQSCGRVRKAAGDRHASNAGDALRELGRDFEKIRPVFEAVKNRCN